MVTTRDIDQSALAGRVTSLETAQGASGNFSPEKLVSGVFLNEPHYEWDGTNLYVKPNGFAGGTTVAYIRGGYLADGSMTYATIKANLAEVATPTGCAVGVTSPSGVIDCIKLGATSLLMYVPATFKFTWSNRVTNPVGAITVVATNNGALAECTELVAATNYMRKADLNKKLDAALLQTRHTVGHDPAITPTNIVVRNRRGAHIHIKPLPADAHIRRVTATGENVASYVMLYAMKESGGTLTTARTLTIPVGIATIDTKIYFKLNKGEYLGVGQHWLSQYRNAANSLHLAESFDGDTTTSTWAFDNVAVTSPYTPTSLTVGTSVPVGAYGLELGYDDTANAISDMGFATQANIDTAADFIKGFDKLSTVPLLEYGNDVFWDAIGSTGNGSNTGFTSWMIANRAVPTDGHLKRIKIANGAYSTMVFSFRIYRPKDDGLHDLISEHLVPEITANVKGTFELPEQVAVQKGDRIAFLYRGLQSSYQIHLDHSLGTSAFTTVDPVTQVFQDIAISDARVYAIGFEMETYNYTPAQRKKASRGAPETIVVRRSGQSNNENYSGGVPINQPDAFVYHQISGVLRHYQNGNVNEFEGYDAPFLDTYARINRERYDFTPNMIAVDGAQGGTDVLNLMRGSVPYTDYLTEIALISEAEKGAYQVIPIFAQGEKDEELMTSRPVYAARVVEYAEQIHEDTLGWWKALPLLALQCTNVDTNITDLADIMAVAGGTLDASDHPLVCNLGPSYGHVGIGGMSGQNQVFHYSNRTQQMHGAISAYAAHEYLAGREYEALRVRDVRVIGNDIILQLNKGNVVLDTTIVPAQTDYGIGVYNAAGAKQTLTSVTLEGGGRIRIKLASPPAAEWKVRVGEKIAPTTATQMQPYAGCATNVRVNRPLLYTEANPTFTSDPVYEWLCAEDIKL